ncbi:MAG: thiol reductant ABC exporter subunit CydC [Chloroflexi bacterium]|nr:thiol reductant ABC exporter subunit CydC [Chloroflexota bacterium]
MVKTVLKLLKFLQPFLKEIFLSVFLGVAAIGSGVGLLATSAYLIASAALHPSIAELQVAIVGVRFFGISRAGFRYLERLVSHSVNLHILSNLRQWFYRSVEEVTPREFFSRKAGDLLDRVMGDLEMLENFYVRVVSPVVVAGVVGFGVSLFVGGFVPALGWILASGLFFTGFLLPLEAILVTQKISKQMTQTRSNLSSQWVEMMQGLEDLQAFGAEKRWMNEIFAQNLESSRMQTKLSFLAGINSGIFLAAMNFTVLGILWAAIPLVRSGEINGVSLAVVLLVVMASFESTASLPQAALNLNASLYSASRIFSLASRSENLFPETRLPFDFAPRAIHMKGVSLRYEEGTELSLNDISLTLEPGRKIALIGASGAGKTSLLNLLLNFRIPESGSIEFDQIRMDQLDPYEVRSNFAVISQSTYLFSTSLRDNLLLANSRAQESELIEVLSRVELTDWLSHLPGGLDTWVGDQGLKLSGGERQRVAIARALLQDRPYLLLDEPVIHLDAITGRRITRTILDLFQKCGLLWITHDLTFLECMDEILLLDHGRIVERGPHKELMARSGGYASLVRAEKDKLDQSLGEL